MRIVVEKFDHVVDVTEAVQIVYDALIGSMDYGSGFLDTNEKRAMRRLADIAGFSPPEFEDDGCYDCGHERQWHYSDGCHISVVTREAVYERKMLTRQVRTMPESVKERMAQAMRMATSPQEVLLIAAGAAAMEDVREEMYEGTVTVSPQERTNCGCKEFK